MGSRHASGDGAESNEETGEREATRLLAYLIRSGQIRLVTQDTRGLELLNEDSSDDEEPYIECKPEADKCPDTKAIDKSELKQEMLTKAGLKHDACLPKDVSVSRMLRKRALGGCTQGHFTHNDCAMLGANFLPNQMETKARFSTKAFCGTYSRDGNVFLSACQDQYLRLYDVTKGRFDKFREIRARDVGWSIVDTAFSPDGCYLIYSSWSECIHLCNIYGDYETHNALDLRPGDGHFCAFSVKFSSDNTEILAGANDGHLYIYDRDKNARVLRIEAHEDDVNAVCFADDSSQIVFSGGDDGLCHVWDRRMLDDSSASPVGTLAGHTDGITFIDSKGDSRHLISNSKDQTIKLWDMRHFSSSSAIESCRRAVATQHWDYRWQSMPRKSKRRAVVRNDSSLMTYRGHGVLHTLIRCYFSPAFSTGQRYIYSGCGTGKVVIYDVLTGKIVSKLAEHNGAVRDVSWHPYEPKIMSTSWDGSHGLWTHKKDDYPEDFNDPEDSLNDSSDDGNDIFTAFRRKSRRLQQQRRRRERRQQRSSQEAR